MRLGIIGMGPWGDVYSRTLANMGISHWHAGRDWPALSAPDGIIIATDATSHFLNALSLIRHGMPVIVEKPLCLSSTSGEALLEAAREMNAIVFTGHTRLYSPAWREFKAKVGRVDSVFMQAGGPSKLGWLWDWCPHLVAMCLDLGFDPLKAHLVEMPHRVPISVTVNGDQHFVDGPTTPTALEVLITEFCEAIEKGEPNIEGLELGVKVVETLEKMEEAVGEATSVCR